MRTTMAYTRGSRLRQILVVGAVAFAAVAHAQFDVNTLSGKKFGDVKKILGTPLETTGQPITYSRFKTSGAIDTMVWYSYNEDMGGTVGKVMVYIPAKPGETAADAPKVLKRYKLSQGSNIKVYVGTKLPSKAMVSVGEVPGIPWKRVYISFKVAQTYKPETMKYCKEHKLDPTKTFFWTVMVRNAKHWKTGFGKD
jgi:hypothetical protein